MSCEYRLQEKLVMREKKIYIQEMKEKRGPGQPTKGEKALSERVNFRTTKSEKDKLFQLAIKAGRTVSEFIRNKIGLGRKK